MKNHHFPTGFPLGFPGFPNVVVRSPQADLQPNCGLFHCNHRHRHQHHHHQEEREKEPGLINGHPMVIHWSFIIEFRNPKISKVGPRL